MSKGINKVTILGNLGSDPEVKYTQGGTCITTISVATTSVRKDRDGNTQEKTEWHRIKLWGKLGEIAGEYLKKGRQVYIEGRLSYGKYEKDGVTHYTTDIIADEMQMLGGGGDRSGSGESGGQSSQGGSSRGYANRGNANAGSKPAPTQTRNDVGNDFADDEIPF